jgi:hypothetical protein
MGILFGILFAAAAQKLLDELKARFPTVAVLDALGVVYPEYWEQDDCDTSFHKYLNVLKEFYREPKWVGKEGEKKFIPTMLDKYKLESKQPLFQMAMVSN